jgi:hypothetical protein
MMTSHPASSPLSHDPGGPERPHRPARTHSWLEARIPAVLAAVAMTLMLIAAWKALRQ